MTVQASSAQLSTMELKHFEEAQKTDEELQEVFSQSEEQLQRKKLRISPQGILYHVEGELWLMVVLKVLQQKIIRENHDVLAIGHVGLIQNYGPRQKSFLVAWYVEHRGRIRAILSSLLVGEIRPLEEGGVLQPIPLLERKWQQITTTLFTDLLESDGKTAIAVFVDRLS